MTSLNSTSCRIYPSTWWNFDVRRRRSGGGRFLSISAPDERFLYFSVNPLPLGLNLALGLHHLDADVGEDNQSYYHEGESDQEGEIGQQLMPCVTNQTGNNACK